MARKMKIGAILFGILIGTALILGGCAEKKEEPKKMQTVADKALPDEGFKGKISVENAPATMKMNTSMNVKVKLKNMGSHVWPAKGQADGKFKINVTYRWLDKDNRVAVPDGIRTGLPHDVNPNEEITLEAQGRRPLSVRGFHSGIEHGPGRGGLVPGKRERDDEDPRQDRITPPSIYPSPSTGEGRVGVKRDPI